jgi:hypothetical protein
MAMSRRRARRAKQAVRITRSRCSQSPAWAAEQDLVAGRRDDVVRAAVTAGLSKSEVHRLTGIARTTIDRIVSAAQAAEEGAQK